MRGFTKRPHKTVTFTQGDESITYTVHPLPVLFMPMVREMIPAPEEMSREARIHVMDRRALAMVAEALRPTEEGLPAHPSPSASPEEWEAYTEALGATFTGAGLTSAMVNTIGLAVDELERDTLQQLETAGND